MIKKNIAIAIPSARCLLINVIVLSLVQIGIARASDGVVLPNGTYDYLSKMKLAHALESIRDTKQLIVRLDFDTSETPVARGPEDVQGRTCLVTDKKYVAELVAMMSELKVANTPLENDEFSIGLTFERDGKSVFQAEFPSILQTTSMTIGVINGRYAEFGGEPILRLSNFALDAFSVPSERKPCSQIVGAQ